MHFLSKPIPRRASCCGGLRYSGGLNGGSDGDRDGGGGERERQTETPVDRVIRLGLPPGHNHIRCTSLQLQTLNYLSPPTDNDSHPYIPVNKLVPICFLMGNLYIYD